MPTFISLLNFTHDGIQALAEQDPDTFLDPTREVIENHGGTLLDYHLTLGQYDGVAIVEFPDAETATEALLQSLQGGLVSTETLRAFDEDQARSFVASLSSEE